MLLKGCKCFRIVMAIFFYQMIFITAIVTKFYAVIFSEMILHIARPYI